MIIRLSQSSTLPTRRKNSSRTTCLPLTAVGGRAFRLVLQHVLDLGHDFGSDFGQQLHGLAVVLDLRDLGGAEDDGADVGVHDAPKEEVLVLELSKYMSWKQHENLPRERKLRDGATKLLSDLGELSDLLDLGLALLGLQSADRVLEEGLVLRKAAVLGDAVVVLAGEETGGQRGPDGGAVLELLVQRRVLDLEALAVEGVVLRLLGDGGDEVVPGGGLLVAVFDLRSIL